MTKPGENVEPNTQETEKVALFDLDGTLADLDQAKDHYMRLLQAPEEKPYVTVYSDNMPAHMLSRWNLVKHQPGFWRNLPKHPLGFEVLEMAKEIGFDPMILTKSPRRPRAAAAEKLEWCDIHVPDIPITLSDDKGIVYGKVLCDDWPSYISRWLMWRPRGLVIMVAHPYNENFFHPNVVRYDGSANSRETVRERMRQAYNR